MDIRLLPMALKDLDEVMAIEEQSHVSPWTIGNFTDSLHAGYWAYSLRQLAQDDEAADPLLGYCVLMPVVDELQLLNITIAPSFRRRGLARKILRVIEDAAQSKSLKDIFLEVRLSNQPAISLYQALAYQEVGRRKDYYPAANGQREDALLMKKSLVHE
jgi:ribosomal-protein-alanine N-acetyltransferase